MNPEQIQALKDVLIMLRERKTLLVEFIASCNERKDKILEKKAEYIAEKAEIVTMIEAIRDSIEDAK